MSKTEFAIARQPASPGGLLGQCAAEGQRVGYGLIAGGIQPWARRRRASVCVCVAAAMEAGLSVRAALLRSSHVASYEHTPTRRTPRAGAQCC